MFLQTVLTLAPLNINVRTLNWLKQFILFHVLAEGSCCQNRYGHIGSDTRGTMSRTKTGKKCQNWEAQEPHVHDNYPELKPEGGLGDHNYCRNPDGSSEGAWCYTMDPNSRWEYCSCSK